MCLRHFQVRCLRKVHHWCRPRIPQGIPAACHRSSLQAHPVIHLLANQVQRQARIHQICRVDRRVQRHLASPVHSPRTFLPLHQVDLLPSFPARPRTVVQVRRLRTSHQLAQACFTPYTQVRHHRKHRVRSLQVYQRILQAGRRRRGHLEIQARSRPVSLLCFHPLNRPRYLLGSQQADPRVNRVSFQV